MRFIHLSDLHLGKRVNGFSMLEDQEYILARIIEIIKKEEPDFVVIAGDVYDKTTPSAEAVKLFDDFLYKLSKLELKAFVISGNHDSPERIAFASRIMNKEGIYMSPVYDGKVDPVLMSDEYGKVYIYMLPFLKPANVKAFYEEEIESYTDAIHSAISHMEIDEGSRNIIISHQFVTGAIRSDSESISVGGSDNVDASVFEKFDYVALGHIHGPQNIVEGKIRYCGTPLKYSFSEKNHRKSVTIVDIFEKGNIKIRTEELIPKHDVREIRGTYDELTLRSSYEGTKTDDYIHAVLTDEEDVFDAISKLRTIYPNIMKLDYDNTRTRKTFDLTGTEQIKGKSEIEMFDEFYEKQNGMKMSEKQKTLSEKLIQEIKEGQR